MQMKLRQTGNDVTTAIPHMFAVHGTATPVPAGKL
jgi:hypothetical protein